MCMSKQERIQVTIDTILLDEFDDGSALVEIEGTKTIIQPDKWERYNSTSNTSESTSQFGTTSKRPYDS